MNLRSCRFAENKGGSVGAVVINNTKKVFIGDCVFEDNRGNYASFALDSVVEMGISGCSLIFTATPGTSNIGLLRRSGNATIFFSGNTFRVSSNRDEMDGFHLYCTAQAVWNFSRQSVFDTDKNKSLYFLHGEPSGLSDHCEFSSGGDKKPLSSGAVAGIVIAVIVVLGISAAALLWFVVIRPRRAKAGFTRTMDEYII